MTDIDLVDWTIQEAQHLKTERRGPSDFDDKSSLDKLLAVLEREPVRSTNPKVPQITSTPTVQITLEELQARPSGEAVTATNPVTVSDPRPYRRPRRRRGQKNPNPPS
jgi:hypothetical protein